MVKIKEVVMNIKINEIKMRPPTAFTGSVIEEQRGYFVNVGALQSCETTGGQHSMRDDGRNRNGAGSGKTKCEKL